MKSVFNKTFNFNTTAKIADVTMLIALFKQFGALKCASVPFMKMIMMGKVLVRVVVLLQCYARECENKEKKKKKKKKKQKKQKKNKNKNKKKKKKKKNITLSSQHCFSFFFFFLFFFLFFFVCVFFF